MVGVQTPSHRHLHLHGSSAVHRLAPETKLLGLFLFVLAVALTPRMAVAAFVVDAVVLVGVARVAKIPFGTILTRLSVIVPFVSFALFLPFLSDGPATEVAGLTLSVDGLWAMWNTIAKATLGATAGIIMVATTPIPEILAGLSRLRLPALFVSIIAFMFRYLDLVIDELTRMRRAMVARGHDARWLWQARPIAASAGTLFVRTYERGERVHDAMLARGFTGDMPVIHQPNTNSTSWLLAVTPALIAGIALVISVVVT